MAPTSSPLDNQVSPCATAATAVVAVAAAIVVVAGIIAAVAASATAVADVWEHHSATCDRLQSGTSTVTVVSHCQVQGCFVIAVSGIHCQAPASQQI